VEQNPSNLAQFGPEAIHNTNNPVRVEYGVHRQITGYFASKDFFTNGLRVRDWLPGQSFEEQTQFGLESVGSLSGSLTMSKLIPDAKLIRDYSSAARDRGHALEAGDSDSANIQFDALTSIYKELKRGRGLDGLAKLGDDPDPYVRAAAGWALIEQDPQVARRLLDQVASLPGLPGFSAQMTLREWDKGRLKFPAAAE